MVSETRRIQNRVNKKHMYERNISNRNYYCEKCNKACRDNIALIRHNDGKKHNVRYKRYPCKLLLRNGTVCNFSSKGKQNLEIHMKIKKHIYSHDFLKTKNESKDDSNETGSSSED